MPLYGQVLLPKEGPMMDLKLMSARGSCGIKQPVTFAV